MELYRKVRLACRDGMSERAAARHFGVSRQSVRKMLQFSVPPGYRRTAPVRRPKLDEFTGLIEQWLEDDRRHGYVDRVVIGCGAEVIARHPRSKGLPIGSGVVEAACKTLVTERLKRSGMRWGPRGGQAILTLRSLVQSRRFDHAWTLLAHSYRTPVSCPDNVVPLRRANIH